MSQNTTLNLIKETEEKAGAIRAQAGEDARSLTAAARRDAEQRFETSCAQISLEKAAALKAAEAEAAALIEEHRKDAVFEAERLRNRAVRYGEEAVKFICMELEKKCQL